MNSFSIYILLILIFLGLSKSFSPSEQRAKFIKNENVFSSHFYGSPISVILEEEYQTGFLIKTYFQKYRVIHGFKAPDSIVVRTTYKFWQKNQKNIGMSLFRRGEKDQSDSTAVLPPGSLYLGDPAYGHWEISDSGIKKWHFHRAYRHFSSLFRWKKFRPSFNFYQKVELYKETLTPFYGLKNEFGTDGSITKLSYKKVKQETKAHESFGQHLKKILNFPKWK